MSDGALIGIGAVVLIALMVFAGFSYNAEHKQWQAFSEAHHCKVVGQMSGDLLVSPVVSSRGGVAVTSTPDKTGWLCDDGVTYWRDR